MSSARPVLLAVAVMVVYAVITVLAQMNRDGRVCEVPVSVEILNGCGKPGIAERTSEYLMEHGFDIMYVGNADDFNYPETVIVDRTGDRCKARAVAKALGTGGVIYQTTSVFFVDVTVILGNDLVGSALPVAEGD
jgi:hypothetical protein